VSLLYWFTQISLSSSSCFIQSTSKWLYSLITTSSKIAFLHKKSKSMEAIKSIFQMWSNTTSHLVKILHTDNRREYLMLDLQFFLREQEIIYKTSTLHIHQQNSCAKWSNHILLEKDTVNITWNMFIRFLVEICYYNYNSCHLLGISNRKYLRRSS